MVIVNARFLTQKTTGVQRFAIEISKKLNKSKLKIEFIAPCNIINKEVAEELSVKSIGPSFISGHLWEQTILPIYVFKKKALLISFCNTAPVTLKNQIVTIHDIGFKINPKWVSKSFAFFYNIVVPIIASRSKHIITVSDTSKEEIASKLKISKNKITVVYNAVSSVFKKQYLNINKDQNYLLDNDYILTVSSHHPRKNFKRLIKAFTQIQDKSIQLYIVGNSNKNFDQTMIENVKSDRIKFLKNIDDKTLASYYKNARLFVYASLYEGFGIPIIEALSQNVPVCVSDIAIFREVCGENAVYFSPTNVEDMVEKMNISMNYKSKKSYDLSKYDWFKSAKLVEDCLNSYIK